MNANSPSNPPEQEPRVFHFHASIPWSRAAKQHVSEATTTSTEVTSHEDAAETIRLAPVSGGSGRGPLDCDDDATALMPWLALSSPRGERVLCSESDPSSFVTSPRRMRTRGLANLCPHRREAEGAAAAAAATSGSSFCSRRGRRRFSVARNTTTILPLTSLTVVRARPGPRAAIPLPPGLSRALRGLCAARNQATTGQHWPADNLPKKWKESGNRTLDMTPNGSARSMHENARKTKNVVSNKTSCIEAAKQRLWPPSS